MVKISVLMPVYNGEKYLKQTIESVLGQSYSDFEFIIVDDGSTDSSVQIVRGFGDSRIRLIQANHGGIVGALNRGMEEAAGEYLARIDADDVCLPHRLETQLKYMESNDDVVVCGTWASTIDENGNVTGALEYPPVEDQEIRNYMILHNPFIHPSVMFRRKAVVEAGAYKNFKHTEDYELWTRALCRGKGHNIPERLIQYRIHSSQVTRTSNLKMKLVGIIVRILALFRI